jgi:hypothetical protein
VALPAHCTSPRGRPANHRHPCALRGRFRWLTPNYANLQHVRSISIRNRTFGTERGGIDEQLERRSLTNRRKRAFLEYTDRMRAAGADLLRGGTGGSNRRSTNGECSSQPALPEFEPFATNAQYSGAAHPSGRSPGRMALLGARASRFCRLRQILTNQRLHELSGFGSCAVSDSKLIRQLVRDIAARMRPTRSKCGTILRQTALAFSGSDAKDCSRFQITATKNTHA